MLGYYVNHSKFFCIPRQSDPWKVTQEVVSLLTVKSKLTLLMRKSSTLINSLIMLRNQYTLKPIFIIK